MSIKNNITEIRKTVGKKVKIIAVTKGRSTTEIRDAMNAGITDIGENRIQEAKEKLPKIHKMHHSALSSWPKGKAQTKYKKITKHFIGRLQTNKVRDAVRLFDMIQSVGSLKLAQKISQECGKIEKTMPILIQVNTSNELQKGGVAPDELDKLIKQVSELPNIRIEGLMTIAIVSDDKDEVRRCFKKLNEKYKNLKSKFDFKWLSMGMSGDYKIAIEEGANMVRIGRGIFG